jgi:hypothetical protein
VVGDTYTILLSGDDTGGRSTLIDMYVPPGGGPPPHRYDFEEAFIITEGQLDITFRGASRSASADTTINVPANAPHQFCPPSCMCRGIETRQRQPSQEMVSTMRDAAPNSVSATPQSMKPAAR